MRCRQIRGGRAGEPAHGESGRRGPRRNERIHPPAAVDRVPTGLSGCGTDGSCPRESGSGAGRPACRLEEIAERRAAGRRTEAVPGWMDYCRVREAVAKVENARVAEADHHGRRAGQDSLGPRPARNITDADSRLPVAAGRLTLSCCAASWRSPTSAVQWASLRSGSSQTPPFALNKRIASSWEGNEDRGGVAR